MLNDISVIIKKNKNNQYFASKLLFKHAEYNLYCQQIKYIKL